MRRFCVQLLLGAVVAVTAVVVAAQPAAAAVHAAAGSPGPFSWLEVKDSSGVSIWSYGTLPISDGGITSPSKMIWSFTTALLWLAYLAVVMFGVFVMYLVTSFAWLAPVADIFESLGDSFDAVVEQFGLVPTLLTATACAAGFLVMRGRWAAGIWEIAAAVVVSVIGLSLLADPVSWVAGPNGVLKQANEAGLEISSDLGTDAQTGGAKLSDVQTAQSTKIVDTFVSSPAQMISFGKVLSPSCEEALAEQVRAGKDADDVRDAVGDCDKKAGEYADNPGPMGMMTLLFLMPTGVLFVGMITLLSGGVFVSSLWALWSGLKILWNAVVALLPFGARGPLFQSIADVFAAAVIVGMSSIFLGGFLLVIDGVFADRSDAGWPPMASFILVDFLIIGGAMVWHRQRAQLKRASAKVAQAMSWRPSGGPVGAAGGAAGAAAGGLSAGRVAHSAVKIGHAAAMVYGHGRGGAPSPGAETGAASVASTSTSRATSLPALSSTTPPPALPAATSDASRAGGPGPGTGDGGPAAEASAGRSAGKNALARKVAVAGAQVAAAAATGGASAAIQATAVQGAAAAARAARPPLGELPPGSGPATRPGSTQGPADHPPAHEGPAAAPASPTASGSRHAPVNDAAAAAAASRSRVDLGSAEAPAAGAGPRARSAAVNGRAAAAGHARAGAAGRPRWTRVVTDGGQVVYQPVEE